MADPKAKKPANPKAKQPIDPKAQKKQEKAQQKKAKDKEKARAEAEVAAAEAPAPVEVERKPADPRLRIMKKFKGRFLPKGPLRERHIELIARWNSGEDHGGVTLEEWKSLHQDWRASLKKTPAGAAKG